MISLKYVLVAVCSGAFAAQAGQTMLEQSLQWGRLRLPVTLGDAAAGADLLFACRDAENCYSLRLASKEAVLSRRFAAKREELAKATLPGEGNRNFVIELEILPAGRDRDGPAWFVDGRGLPAPAHVTVAIRTDAGSEPLCRLEVDTDLLIPGSRGQPYWINDILEKGHARAPFGQGLAVVPSAGTSYGTAEVTPAAPANPPPAIAVKPDRILKIEPSRGGCWLAVGDLTGDGRPEFVVARNNNQAVTAVTALAADGRVLWTWGQGGSADIAYDVPCTVYDLDGDGAGEVLISVEGQLLVLDGKTGSVRRKLPLPDGLRTADCILVANLTGKTRPSDLIIKSRYEQIFAYDADWKPLWTWKGNTGHHPAVGDVNGDGRDEVLVGYALLAADGKPIWEQKLPDHADTDRIVEWGGKIYLLFGCGGGNDMALATPAGELLWRVCPNGGEFHFQSAHAGEVRPDIEGFEIIVDDGWARPGRAGLAIFSQSGRRLGTYYARYQRFTALFDWQFDGVDEIVIPCDHGLFDGRGNRVVDLVDAPQMGGPGAESPFVRLADLDADGRDELILFNAETICVYRAPGTEKPPARRADPLRQGNFTYY
jgi:hypothetical protein